MRLVVPAVIVVSLACLAPPAWSGSFAQAQVDRPTGRDATPWKDNRLSKEANDILDNLEAKRQGPSAPPSPPLLAKPSSETPATEPPQKSFEAYEGYDVPGEDIGEAVRGVSGGECETRCATETRCNAYTFDRRNGWCFLKSGAGRLEANEKALSGVSRALPQPSVDRNGIREFLTYDGYDIPGGDLGAPLRGIPLDRCREVCRDNPRCDAFTYDKKSRWCFPKSGVSARADNPKAVSGVLVPRGHAPAQAPTVGKGGMRIQQGTDLMGMDLEPEGIRPTTLDTCQRLCVDNPRCKAFSWVEETRWCWPKSAVPEARNRPGVMSGYRN